VWGDKAAAAIEADLRALPPGEIGRYRTIIEDPRIDILGRSPAARSRVEKAREVWEEATAGQLAQRIESIPPGDLAAYHVVKEQADALPAGTGRAAEVLQPARAAWGRRSAEALIRAFRELAPGDSAGYERTRGAGAVFVGAFPEHRDAIRAAEAAWGDRTIDQLAAEVEPLLGSDPGAASERLRTEAKRFAAWDAQAAAQGRLRDLRRRALELALDRAKAETRELIRAHRYARATRSAVDFRTRWSDEAAAVEKSADLDYLVDSYAFLAELARKANKPDPE
jgi:hypothetical protein